MVCWCPGGVGKNRQKKPPWRGVDIFYWFSFYTGGGSDRRCGAPEEELLDYYAPLEHSLRIYGPYGAVLVLVQDKKFLNLI